MSSKLALCGGEPAVTAPQPHCKWPPAGGLDELAEIRDQRNADILLKGKCGPVAALEEKFLEFLGNEAEYSVSFNSGTSALLASYCAVGIGPGDEVIGPSLTFHAAMGPAFVLGAQIVLADVDEKTKSIDPARIEDKITPRTKAITVVHQWGHPADMDRVMEIARRHGLAVIEDCSHAHGSKYKGRFCGSFGDVAAFSLHANKTVWAGEGGMLVTNDPLVRDRATLLGHYRDRSRDEVTDPVLHEYAETGFGLKLRMSGFNAIVARHSLARFPEIDAGRNKCVEYFSDQLEKIPYLEVPRAAGDVEMVWYRYKPLYKPQALGGMPRAKLIAALQAEGCFAAAPPPLLLASLPMYNSSRNVIFPDQPEKVPSRPEDFPVGREIQEAALTIPTFYDWPRHRPIIDQYVEAFRKIERSAEELAALEL